MITRATWRSISSRSAVVFAGSPSPIAAARTILDEVLGVCPDYIEHQLAHAVRDPNGRAYNRTAHLPERRKMMQQWADYLDRLKAGAEAMPLYGHMA